jgi:hypothetical protein
MLTVAKPAIFFSHALRRSPAGVHLENDCGDPSMHRNSERSKAHGLMPVPQRCATRKAS